MSQKQLLALLTKLKAGEYTLAELTGTNWVSIRNKNDFGRSFKEAVKNGSFPNVAYIGDSSSHHARYRVS